jgi:hypothetical protein
MSRLIARRLAKLEAQTVAWRAAQTPAWMRTVGLHALLQAAEAAEAHDDTDLAPSDLAPTSSMQRLLDEARRYRAKGAAP